MHEALLLRRGPDIIEKDQRPEGVRSNPGVIMELIPSQGRWCPWCRIEWCCPSCPKPFFCCTYEFGSTYKRSYEFGRTFKRTYEFGSTDKRTYKFGSTYKST